MASSQIQQPINAVEGSMKNLKADAASKVAADGGNNNNNSVVVPALKDGSVSDAVSCISSADAASSYKESEVETEALMPEHSIYYPAYGYYYQGFDGSFGGWDAQSYYIGSDGLEIQSSVRPKILDVSLQFLPRTGAFDNRYSRYIDRVSMLCRSEH